MVLGKNIAHDMKSGAEGAHFFGALLLTFSFDKHTKLYCTRKQSPERTLSKLLNLLQDNRHLFRAEDDIKGLIKEAKLRLADMEPEISILAKRRDKYMAHNDPMCFERDFNPGKELFLGEGVVLALLTFSERLCMEIFSCLDKRDICIRMKNSGDLDNLFSNNPQ